MEKKDTNKTRKVQACASHAPSRSAVVAPRSEAITDPAEVERLNALAVASDPAQWHSLDELRKKLGR